VKCSRCNRGIDFVRRWTGQRVCCEAEPGEHHQESFVEVELGEFVSVFRHECEEPKEPYKYQPLNQVFRGSKKYPRKGAQPELFGEP
jgi:hypothetical protein